MHLDFGCFIRNQSRFFCVWAESGVPSFVLAKGMTRSVVLNLGSIEPRGSVSQFQGFSGRISWAIKIKYIKFMIYILFFQLRRVRWIHVWNLWGSVPPTRLRTTGLGPVFRPLWISRESVSINVQKMSIISYLIVVATCWKKKCLNFFLKERKCSLIDMLVIYYVLFYHMFSVNDTFWSVIMQYLFKNYIPMYMRVIALSWSRVLYSI